MKKIVVIASVIVAVIIVGIFVIIGIVADESNENSDITVGLILNGNADDKSWSQSHYEAMNKTASSLGLNFVCRESVPEPDVEKVIDELITEGSDIIICNSFGYGEYLPEIARKYPEIYFFHASGNDYDENLISYFGRMYQIRYLSGIAAGLQTETDEIGYVAAFPISEVNRGINAFTLGVRSVNPDAKVYVSWTNSWTDDNAARESTEKLIENHNIDIITMHVDSIEPLKTADENNVLSIGYNFDNSESYPDTYFTAAVWSWENFYIPHITACIRKKFEGGNYWEGIGTGIVSLVSPNHMAKEGVAEAVNAEKELLESGAYDVFYGPICDSDGNIRIAEGESMTDEALLGSFDWYVEGVVPYEE